MLNRVFVVALLAGAVLCGAAFFALQLLARWLAARSVHGDDPQLAEGVARWRSESRAHRWVRAGCFVAAGVVLVAIVDAVALEPFWPVVTHTRLTTRHSRAPRVRIVQLTDLHSDPQPRLEPRIPELVRGLQPDLIVFTGDALNSPEGLPHFSDCMKSLAALAPTYAVAGNWDVWYWSRLELFGGTGVKLLAGEGVELSVRGRPVWLGGAGVEDTAGITRSLAGVPRDRLTLWLHHYPETIRAASAAGVDVMLAGDTHGGQLRLPLFGPLIEMQRFGTYYDQGLHRVGPTQLYVNRGIGMEGGSAPRARFWCRPEIAVLDIE